MDKTFNKVFEKNCCTDNIRYLLQTAQRFNIYNRKCFC